MFLHITTFKRLSPVSHPADSQVQGFVRAAPQRPHRISENALNFSANFLFQKIQTDFQLILLDFEVNPPGLCIPRQK
jgi:hypothetical protein